MLQMGMIQPFQNSWASPIVLIPKSDREVKFSVDCRKLNEVMHPDLYSMPRVDELLVKLGHANYISTLDLTTGF